MSRHIFACSTAGVFALAIGIAAQTPPAGGAQAPPQAPPAAAAGAGAASATVEGCLVLEKEEYILSSAKVLKGTAPASASAAAPAPTGTAGGGAAAAGAMFDVRGLDQARLKPFEGKRVEIDGTFAAPAGGATASAADHVDIRATAVRASTSTATCPAK